MKKRTPYWEATGQVLWSWPPKRIRKKKKIGYKSEWQDRIGNRIPKKDYRGREDIESYPPEVSLPLDPLAPTNQKDK